MVVYLKKRVLQPYMNTTNVVRASLPILAASLPILVAFASLWLAT